MINRYVFLVSCAIGYVVVAGKKKSRKSERKLIRDDDKGLERGVPQSISA